MHFYLFFDFGSFGPLKIKGIIFCVIKTVQYGKGQWGVIT